MSLYCRSLRGLIVEDDTMYPLEIKKGKASVHSYKNFKVLDKFKMKLQSGIIICMAMN